MRNPLLIPALGALLLLTGCEIWKPGGTVYTASKNSFSIKVPAGWTFTDRRILRAADLLATRDGVFLQQIYVEHHLVKDPLPHSKRSITAQLTPFEVADAVADDLRSDRALLNIALTENTPATVGGQPGFKLVLNYQTADHLRLTEIRYGAVVGDRVWFLRFIAPSRHYFERDRAAFEETAQSLQLNKV